MLTYSHSLKFGQVPEYGVVRRSFASLAEGLGYSLDSGPLDWTPCYPQTANLILNDLEVSLPNEDDDEDDSEDELGKLIQ